MKGLSTGRVFAALLAVYALLLLPALFFEGYLQTPIGVLIYVPYLSVYLFDWLGVPWLLVNGGVCGWGWCAPSWFGWLFVGAVWAGLAWLAAWALNWGAARLARMRSERLPADE
ncbi:MAG TPA: hypothetical protein VFY22_03740 [Hydrogenophaga sp.]|nr:hypothetical protein [Hydrogenophaga sp.]